MNRIPGALLDLHTHTHRGMYTCTGMHTYKTHTHTQRHPTPHKKKTQEKIYYLFLSQVRCADLNEYQMLGL